MSVVDPIHLGGNPLASALRAQARALEAVADALDQQSASDEWLTPKEAEPIAKRKERQIRAAGKSGAFEMRGTGRHCVIRKTSLLAWLETLPLRRVDRHEADGLEVTVTEAEVDARVALLAAAE